ncbi:hypothetical protein D3C77_745380 [compost metagenome]
MGEWAEAADGSQEQRVEGVEQQRFVDQRHGDQAESRNPQHAGEGRTIDGQC